MTSLGFIKFDDSASACKQASILAGFRLNMRSLVSFMHELWPKKHAPCGFRVAVGLFSAYIKYGWWRAMALLIWSGSRESSQSDRLSGRHQS